MAISGYGSSEYKKLLAQLLPKGRAWGKDSTGFMMQLLEGLGVELGRVDSQAICLIKEYTPTETDKLLEEWELDYGLPESCLQNSYQTIAERRDALVAKVTTKGSLRPNYYIDMAADLGYTITISEFAPFWCGYHTSGTPCGTQQNLFYWLVQVESLTSIRRFLCGSAVSGDPLSDTGDISDLICMINARKPAHSHVLYEIIGPEFDEAFSSAFNSKPSGSVDWLEGAFFRSFSRAFNVKYGGAFNKSEFAQSFDITA